MEINQDNLLKILDGLALGDIHYFSQVGSTNDVAAEYAAKNAPDLTVIVADEQTRGRGRRGKKWYTPHGSALAFSVILKPDHLPIHQIARLSGLGGLAVWEGIQSTTNLDPEIKWPNDVLVDGKKVSGILAEAKWEGNQLKSMVLGIGLNITRESLNIPVKLNFEPTYLEAHLDYSVERLVLLRNILEGLNHWLSLINSSEFIRQWESKLAYRGEKIQLNINDQELILGKLMGLDNAGKLILLSEEGEELRFDIGEIQLRPLVDSHRI